MTDHHKAVADAARAVEEAWDTYCCGCTASEPEDRGRFNDAFSSLLAARRAARDAGYVEVLVGPSLDRPLDTAQYHCVRGEPSSHGGWVWVQNKQPDGKVAVVLSQEAVEALKRTTFEYRPADLPYTQACEIAVYALARDLKDVFKESDNAQR